MIVDSMTYRLFENVSRSTAARPKQSPQPVGLCNLTFTQVGLAGGLIDHAVQGPVGLKTQRL